MLLDDSLENTTKVKKRNRVTNGNMLKKRKWRLSWRNEQQRLVAHSNVEGETVALLMDMK